LLAFGYKFQTGAAATPITTLALQATAGSFLADRTPVLS
jgi:hypothetical protein